MMFYRATKAIHDMLPFEICEGSEFAVGSASSNKIMNEDSCALDSLIKCKVHYASYY